MISFDFLSGCEKWADGGSKDRIMQIGYIDAQQHSICRWGGPSAAWVMSQWLLKGKDHQIGI